MEVVGVEWAYGSSVLGATRRFRYTANVEEVV
jgi:hypothetical protein